jgi:orotate phosphoribosyltransferase
MVEDIVTTGLSSRECIAAIQKAGGEVVAAACIVDRSGGRADVGVPLVALATLDVPAYPADALPPELAAIPTTDPGSRRLSSGH